MSGNTNSKAQRPGAAAPAAAASLALSSRAASSSPLLASKAPWDVAGAQSLGQSQGLPGGVQASTGMTGARDEPDQESAKLQASRDAQLQRLGYHIAERYYQLPLKDLRQAAVGGDSQALTHLAERYLFALEGKPSSPDYEPGFPYAEAAIKSLNEAYVRGNLHAAAMISEAYLLQKRPVDAAAWNQVAQRSGDELSAEWFLRTEDYRQLTAEQRQDAERMAHLLWEQLEKKKKL